MDAIEQVMGPRRNILVLCIFYGVNPPATSTSSQYEATRPGSAAVLAELSAAPKAVPWLVEKFGGALEHAAGSLQEIPASGQHREAGLAS